MTDFFVEPERKTPIMFKEPFDVVVVGGGSAGIAASLAAARNGAKTILIEQHGTLGGTSTLGLCDNFDGIDRSVQGGIFIEMLDRLRAENAALERWEGLYDREILKRIAFELMEKSGVNLLLYAHAVSVVKEDNEIRAVIIEGKSGRLAVTGKVFIDASADADISQRAGARIMKGGKDGRSQAITLLFVISGFDIEKVKQFQESISLGWEGPCSCLHGRIKNAGCTCGRLFFVPHQMVKKARDSGELYLTHEGLGGWFLLRQGQLHFNSIHIIGIDPLDIQQLTRAEIEARKQVTSILNFLKKNVSGFENAYVLTTASMIGVRESARIVGDYVLEEESTTSGESFPDSIGIGNYIQDLHGPDEFHYFLPAHYVIPFDIPYRTLLVKGIDNLLVAGRCISTDFRTQSITRQIPVCYQTGEAAGIAAALATMKGISIRHIEIEDLQSILIKQGGKILRTIQNLKSINEKYDRQNKIFKRLDDMRDMSKPELYSSG